MKWLEKLTDEELTEIYKSFMGDMDVFADLTITRYKNEFILEGHIKIPEDEDGMCLIDEDYSLTDFTVKAYHHSGNMTKQFRTFMYKKFGKKYAEDYLFNS